jgi:hypothetical protein
MCGGLGSVCGGSTLSASMGMGDVVLIFEASLVQCMV